MDLRQLDTITTKKLKKINADVLIESNFKRKMNCFMCSAFNKGNKKVIRCNKMLE